MLLHVNPAEVKGLAQAMPITINPQTGQPEAFLPFLAPIFGSLGFSALAGTGALGATLAATTYCICNRFWSRTICCYRRFKERTTCRSYRLWYR